MRVVPDLFSTESVTAETRVRRQVGAVDAVQVRFKDLRARISDGTNLAALHIDSG